MQSKQALWKRFSTCPFCNGHWNGNGKKVMWAWALGLFSCPTGMFSCPFCVGNMWQNRKNVQIKSSVFLHAQRFHCSLKRIEQCNVFKTAERFSSWRSRVPFPLPLQKGRLKSQWKDTGYLNTKSYKYIKALYSMRLKYCYRIITKLLLASYIYIYFFLLFIYTVATE